MTDWTTFGVGIVFLTVVLLILTRRSREALERAHIVGVDDPPDRDGPPRTFDHPDAVDRNFDDLDTTVGNAADPFLEDDSRAPGVDRSEDVGVPDEPSDGDDRTDSPDGDGRLGTPDGDGRTDAPYRNDRTDVGSSIDGRTPRLTTDLLLVNVAFTQGAALSVLVLLAWWTDVPAAAFGLVAADLAGPILLAGLAAGVVLYVGNEVAAVLGRRVGVTASERLREAMAPADARGWAFLLLVVLPVIAVFEEALFRGALIGAFALGFGLDPWVLAVGSSVLFGLGHGAQGRLGVLVTGALGFVLAALFVLTGSLLLVIVAHYVINALEFGVREGLGWDPSRGAT